MGKLFALATAMIVCAAPALAHPDRPDPDCGRGPEQTGALPADPRGPHLQGERADRIEITPPEENWQEQAQEDAERRRRRLVACGVD